MASYDGHYGEATYWAKVVTDQLDDIDCVYLCRQHAEAKVKAVYALDIASDVGEEQKVMIVSGQVSSVIDQMRWL